MNLLTSDEDDIRLTSGDDAGAVAADAAAAALKGCPQQGPQGGPGGALRAILAIFGRFWWIFGPGGVPMAP